MLAAEAISAAANLARAADDDDAPGAIALELAPLIAPYRKHGRLSLRVERLPHRARLSRGHNNGDRSWSLMSDELDGLVYLPPQGGTQSCTLSIRIVSLDGGDGATLALLDYPVMSEGTPPPVSAALQADQLELRRLREDLEKSKAQLIEQDGVFRAARARWENELQTQLAASSALANEALERQRAEWKAERAPAKSAEASADLRGQIDAALAKAEKEWKLAEADRFARMQAQWEARSTKALSEAGAQLEKARSRAAAESAREKSDESERRRLRDEVARLKKLLGTKESEFAETCQSERRAGEDALAGAERNWREQEVQRLASARAQWQERSERALAEATAQFERSQSARAKEDAARLKNAEAEVEMLKDELARANEILADRENDIADIQQRLDAVADQTPAIEAREGEIERLKSDLAASRAIVAERERDLVAAHSEMDEARREWQRQADTRFAEALAEWKKEEAGRLLAAEAASQEQAEGTLTRMSQRLRQAETELKGARAQADALRQRGDADDVRKLRREFGHLQALLSERETEIAKLRLDSEHARERWTADARMSLEKAEHEWHSEAEEAERRERRSIGMRRTARDVIVVASMSVVAVMVYLHFDLTSLANIFPPLATIIDATPGVSPTAAVPRASAPAKSPTAALAMATVLKSANVRAEPSKSADVVATLPRDSQVATLEHHGNWIRVKMTDANKAREGWVYSTYLKEASPAVPRKPN